MTLTTISGFSRDFAALKRRLEHLRASRLSPGCDDGSVLDAALLEVEAACEELRTSFESLQSQQRSAERQRSRTDWEHHVLRQAFLRAPVPFFVLDHHAAIRRVNTLAARLAGLNPEFSAGKPFPSFVDLPARAPFRSHLAAALRVERPVIFRCRMMAPARPGNVTLILARILRPGVEQSVVLVAALTGDSPAMPRSDAAPSSSLLGAAKDVGSETSDDLSPGFTPPSGAWATAVRADCVRRLDLMGRMTRLLVCGRDTDRLLLQATCLLTAEFADWAVIHLTRNGPNGKPIISGPSSPLTAVRPWSRIIRDVLEAGGPVLLDIAEDEHALGRTDSGAPVLSVIGAASLVCVALRDDEENIGTLTAIRMGGRPAFTLADSALLDEIGSHLGLALAR
jgi:PAS domain-containing protein